ncbi:MAG: serine--tRNA ligase [Candidatus Omnitrophota bacterium]|nr:MAG: serine--tRNA ligase [Candidatus Omnitrophota bacterium]
MLDIKFIRENIGKVKKSIKDRGMKADVDRLLKLDEERRKMLTEVEKLKHIHNEASDEIARLKSEKKDIKSKIAEMKTLSQKIKKFDPKVVEINQKYHVMLLNIPNMPHPSVPIGPDASYNKIIKRWGEQPKFDFNPRSHIELAEFLNIIDFPASAKIAGSGFSLFAGDGAKMVRALINFMIDLHVTKHGYKEIWPPALVNRDSMTNTGQLPKLEEDMYRLKDEDLFLIPTAEVPVTNMHKNEILNEEDIPIYYTAYTPCFRREAGSYGKDTKGLTRVHQFDKVEMVKFVKPEDSWSELESLLANAEEVIQLLNIPYRVAILSTGDLSFAASKCYDIEIWAAGSKKWLEVSSCSNFTDFQAHRGNIKYRIRNSKKTEYVHTLNGSGVAFARLIISILENNQRKDGTVIIPEVLRPYMGNQDRFVS